MQPAIMDNSEIVIYKNPEGNIRIDVTIEGEQYG